MSRDRTEAEGLPAELYGTAGEIDNNLHYLQSIAERSEVSSLLIRAGKAIERLERDLRAEQRAHNDTFDAYHRRMDKLDALRARYDELVDRYRWRQAGEEWPERHRNLLIRYSDGRVFCGRICAGMHEPFFTHNARRDRSDTVANDGVVTHWRYDDPPAAALDTDKGDGS